MKTRTVTLKWLLVEPRSKNLDQSLATLHGIHHIRPHREESIN